MSVVVDALGKQCPIPVVMAKKALAELQTPDTLEILVDNEAALAFPLPTCRCTCTPP